MKTTFIATVLNEEKTIDKLLLSLQDQTIKPDQIIITDGGSTDKTVEKIKIFQNIYHLPLIVLHKKGNRSEGRNAAIEKAKTDIILCSDAGCKLDRNWVKNISQPFIDNSVDVVAGYYQGVTQTVFQKCLIPYVLVMSDKVNPHTFLPATRSMAFRKKVWEAVGMFPKEFVVSEDYVFAKRLQKQKKKIVFKKSAIVYWYPPERWEDAFFMFYHIAKCDNQAGIIRAKVIFLLFRYFMVFLLISTSFFTTLNVVLLLGGLLIVYIIWSILKNYNYVKNLQALFFLPLLQFTADVAVIIGTVIGLFSKYI